MRECNSSTKLIYDLNIKKMMDILKIILMKKEDNLLLKEKHIYNKINIEIP